MKTLVCRWCGNPLVSELNSFCDDACKHQFTDYEDENHLEFLEKLPKSKDIEETMVITVTCKACGHAHQCGGIVGTKPHEICERCGKPLQKSLEEIRRSLEEMANESLRQAELEDHRPMTGVFKMSPETKKYGPHPESADSAAQKPAEIPPELRKALDEYKKACHNHGKWGHSTGFDAIVEAEENLIRLLLAWNKVTSDEILAMKLPQIPCVHCGGSGIMSYEGVMIECGFCKRK